MAEVRLQIPDNLLESMRDKLGPDAKATDIARDAVTLFNWAVEQRAKGLEITSSDPTSGVAKTQVAMASLNSIKASGSL